MKLKFLILFTFSFKILHCQNIEVIFTSALLINQYELRKTEYLNSFHMLRNFGLDPWIIEATNIQHSFYEELTKKICYPQKNNLSFKNIGVNEALSLKHSLHCLPFSDDDMIVKITGRYVLYDSFLIDLIKTNTGFDSYIKWMDNQVFTGCFALKWKHFKKFINNLDMKQMEKNMINLEQKLAEFIIKENLLYYPLDKLHIKARIYGNGQGNITYDL